MRGDRLRWAAFMAAVLAMAALLAYGLRQPAPPRISLWGLKTDPAYWGGREVVLESVHVVEALPGGMFVGESDRVREVFQDVPGVVTGQDLSLRIAVDPAGRKLRVLSARSVPRGLSALRGIIFWVSVAVILVVAVTVFRRFRWSWPAGISVRGEGTAWRIS